MDNSSKYVLIRPMGPRIAQLKGDISKVVQIFQQISEI